VLLDIFIRLISFDPYNIKELLLFQFPMRKVKYREVKHWAHVYIGDYSQGFDSVRGSSMI
jgi:hypothetical protein